MKRSRQPMATLRQLPKNWIILFSGDCACTWLIMSATSAQLARQSGQAEAGSAFRLTDGDVFDADDHGHDEGAKGRRAHMVTHCAPDAVGKQEVRDVLAALDRRGEIPARDGTGHRQELQRLEPLNGP